MPNRTTRPLYSKIRNHIIQQIQTGRWTINYKLPSENEFAAQFGVSRNTVKQALTKLVEEGIIHRYQGKGSFVSENLPRLDHYDTDATANDLSKVKSIAYLMPFLNNSHTTRLLNGIEDAITANGHHLLFRKTMDSQEIEKQALREFIDLGVSGIIIYPATGETYNDEIFRLSLNHFPIVIVDHYLREIETNCVYSDNKEGGRLLTNRLIELGHRYIAFVSISPVGSTSVEDRLSGYKSSILENGLGVYALTHLASKPESDRQPLKSLEDIQTFNKEQIKSFLARQPQITAVIAVNPGIGQLVTEVTEEPGIQLPDSFTVVSFDKNTISGNLNQPFYIDQQVEKIGSEAVQLLLSIMQNPNQERKRISLPPRLIINDPAD